MKTSVNIIDSKDNQSGLYKHNRKCNGVDTWFILLGNVVNGKISGTVISSDCSEENNNRIGEIINNWNVDLFVRLPKGSTVTLEQ